MDPSWSCLGSGAVGSPSLRCGSTIRKSSRAGTDWLGVVGFTILFSEHRPPSSPAPLAIPPSAAGPGGGSPAACRPARRAAPPPAGRRGEGAGGGMEDACETRRERKLLPLLREFRKRTAASTPVQGVFKNHRSSKLRPISEPSVCRLSRSWFADDLLP